MNIFIKVIIKVCFFIIWFFPIKFRRSVLSDSVEFSLIEVCKNISSQYEIHFVEIGADDNHVHFLIQSVPMMSLKSIAQTVKSITAKELFKLHPEVKQKLWGGNFWTSGYYGSAVKVGEQAKNS